VLGTRFFYLLNGWSATCVNIVGRHDTQHNNFQYNDTQHNKNRDIQLNDTQHNAEHCYAECHYALCRYAECHGTMLEVAGWCCVMDGLGI
jgi:hypothetical protein